MSKDNDDAFFSEEMKRLENEFYQGNPHVLFEAIKLFVLDQEPIPGWVSKELSKGLERYRDYQKDYQLHKENMERLENEFYQGNPYVLFEALRRCGVYQEPIPGWVTKELSEGLERYQDYQTHEFGEAFNIPRQRKIKSLRNKFKKDITGKSLLCRVYECAVKLSSEGVGTPELWAYVAEEVGLGKQGASTVRNYLNGLGFKTKKQKK